MNEIITFLLSIVAGIVALRRFPVGVWLCVALLPLSATYLVGRQLFGIMGLNPFNIVQMATILSFLSLHFKDSEHVPFPRMPLIFWAFVGMFVLYGIVGCFYIESAPPSFISIGWFQKWTLQRYIFEQLLKPLQVFILTLLVAVLVRAEKAYNIIWAIACSSCFMAISIIGFIVLNSFTLDELAKSNMRGVLSWTGMHANSLGLFLNMSSAILLFSGLGRDVRKERNFLVGVSLLTMVATLLTFSRGAFLGLAFIGLYYLYSRRRVKELIISMFLLAVVIFAMPQSVYDRAATGLADRDASKISAGRATVIWPELFAVYLENPIFGYGVGSTAWVAPTKIGFIYGHPHNAYLAALLDFGLIGSCIIFVFYMYAWRKINIINICEKNNNFKNIVIPIQICIIILLVQNITDDKFLPNFPHAWLWVIFGFIFPYQINKIEKNKP